MRSTLRIFSNGNCHIVILPHTSAMNPERKYPQYAMAKHSQNAMGLSMMEPRKKPRRQKTGRHAVVISMNIPVFRRFRFSLSSMFLLPRFDIYRIIAKPHSASVTVWSPVILYRKKVLLPFLKTTANRTRSFSFEYSIRL